MTAAITESARQIEKSITDLRVELAEVRAADKERERLRNRKGDSDE
jgi:hypothetical protein